MERLEAAAKIIQSYGEDADIGRRLNTDTLADAVRDRILTSESAMRVAARNATH